MIQCLGWLFGEQESRKFLLSAMLQSRRSSLSFSMRTVLEYYNCYVGNENILCVFRHVLEIHVLTDTIFVSIYWIYSRFAFYPISRHVLVKLDCILGTSIHFFLLGLCFLPCFFLNFDLKTSTITSFYDNIVFNIVLFHWFNAKSSAIGNA